MTDEGKNITDKWIEQKGAEYAYAFDKKAALKRFFNVKGIPAAFLIDANGKVVWSGHPSSLNGRDIEKHLGGTIATPMWEWPKSAKPVKAAVGKKQWSTALGKAESIGGDEGQEVVDSVKTLIASRVTIMSGALEAGDFLTAQDAASELKAGLKGMPEEAQAQEVLASIDSNKQAPKIIKAQLSIRDWRGKSLKKAEYAKAIDEMREIAEDFPDSYVAEEATEFMYELERRQRG